jgi:hypothetical protein
MEKFLAGLKKPFQTAEQQKTNSGNPLASYGLVVLALLITR